MFQLDSGEVIGNTTTEQEVIDAIEGAIISPPINVSADEIIDIVLFAGSVVSTVSVKTEESAEKIRNAVAGGDLSIIYKGDSYTAGSPETAGSGGSAAGFPAWAGAIIAVVVLALLVALFVMMRKRREDDDKGYDVEEANNGVTVIDHGHLSSPRQGVDKYMPTNDDMAGAHESTLEWETGTKENPLLETTPGDEEVLFEDNKSIGRSALSFASLTTGDRAAAPEIRARDDRDANNTSPSARPYASFSMGDEGSSKWRHASNDEIADGVRKLSMAIASNLEGGAKRIGARFMRNMSNSSVVTSRQQKLLSESEEASAMLPIDEDGVGYATIRRPTISVMDEIGQSEDGQLEGHYATIKFDSEASAHVNFGVYYVGSTRVTVMDPAKPPTRNEVFLACERVRLAPRENSNEKFFLSLGVDKITLRSAGTWRKRMNPEMDSTHELDLLSVANCQAYERMVGIVIGDKNEDGTLRYTCYVYRCKDKKRAVKLQNLIVSSCQLGFARRRETMQRHAMLMEAEDYGSPMDPPAQADRAWSTSNSIAGAAARASAKAKASRERSQTLENVPEGDVELENDALEDDTGFGKAIDALRALVKQDKESEAAARADSSGVPGLVDYSTLPAPSEAVLGSPASSSQWPGTSDSGGAGTDGDDGNAAAASAGFEADFPTELPGAAGMPPPPSYDEEYVAPLVITPSPQASAASATGGHAMARTDSLMVGGLEHATEHFESAVTEDLEEPTGGVSLRDRTHTMNRSTTDGVFLDNDTLLRGETDDDHHHFHPEPVSPTTEAAHAAAVQHVLENAAYDASGDGDGVYETARAVSSDDVRVERAEATLSEATEDRLALSGSDSDSDSDDGNDVDFQTMLVQHATPGMLYGAEADDE